MSRGQRVYEWAVLAAASAFAVGGLTAIVLGLATKWWSFIPVVLWSGAAIQRGRTLKADAEARAARRLSAESAEEGRL